MYRQCNLRHKPEKYLILLLNHCILKNKCLSDNCYQTLQTHYKKENLNKFLEKLMILVNLYESALQLIKIKEKSQFMILDKA